MPVSWNIASAAPKSICYATKVIHPKYYKHLKKGAHQSHLGQTENGLVSGRLACTSSKAKISNKIGMNLDFDLESYCTHNKLCVPQ